MKIQLISQEVGLGLILTDLEREFAFKKQSIRIGGDEIEVGNKTALKGKFEVPLEYVGTVEKQCGIVIAFYLGATKENDEVYHYYSCLVYENEDRILNLSSEGVYKKYLLKENGWKEIYV